MVNPIEKDKNLYGAFEDASKPIELQSIRISTTIPRQVHDIAKNKGVGWNEALMFGLQFLLAERFQYEFNYPDNTQTQKVGKMTKLLEEQSIKIEALEKNKNSEEIRDN